MPSKVFEEKVCRVAAEIKYTMTHLANKSHGAQGVQQQRQRRALIYSRADTAHTEQWVMLEKASVNGTAWAFTKHSCMEKKTKN